jgi:LacI family transcriptional regulator
MKKILLATAPFPFMQPLNEGVAAASKRVGPWLIEIHFSDSPEEFSEVVSTRKYDGVIVTYLASNLEKIEKSGTPLVSALGVNDGVDNVVLDEFAIGVMAAEHLVGCGYRSFAYYGYAETWSRARYEGFRDTLAKMGLPLVTTFTGTVRMETQVPAMSPVTPAIFLEGLKPPIAILACNDGAGREIVDVAVELGLSVPRDVAVLGVDNDELRCETGACPLSSVDPNLYRLGFEAALLLDRKMRGENRARHELPPPVPPKEVVRRKSTSVFAYDDPMVATALRMIHERAGTGFSVLELCEALGASRRTFEIRFVKAVGRPPGTEIRNVRIDRGKTLLTETNLALPEIARRCGYAQIEGFSAAFRTVVGLSPAQFRKQQDVEAATQRLVDARTFPRALRPTPDQVTTPAGKPAQGSKPETGGKPKRGGRPKPGGTTLPV